MLLIASTFLELQRKYANSDKNIRVKNLDMAGFDMELLLNFALKLIKAEKIMSLTYFSSKHLK